LALAAQKFIADIATDALQNSKNRQSGLKKGAKDKKNVLTMEDLAPALRAKGINTNRAEFLEK
jgi:transcription initiation factor TFIID subunit 10